MEFVLRALVIYFFLWAVFRISGHRTLAEISTFDLVLLLIISEASDNGLLGDSFSITSTVLLVVTLVTTDIAVSFLKQKSKGVAKALDGIPLVIVQNGKPLKDRMDAERVDEQDVLAAARELQGLERMDQIKYAVLENSGQITIIPNQ